MNSFPFQSNYLGNDEHGNPKYDRAVGAEFWRDMWKLFFTNGVFANPSTNFQVMAHSGMTVRVRPGACFIQGVTSIEIQNTDLRLDNGDDTRDRTDSIVIRADFSQNRRVSIEVKKNTTVLTRNSNIWEICIAQIRVPRNATTITQSNITDTRYNSTLCGVVTNTINNVDTTTLFNQYQDYWNRKRVENENDWNAQMTEQERDFKTELQNIRNTNNRIQTNMQTWFDNHKHDIAKLKGFDLENFFDLKGAYIRSYKSGNSWTTLYYFDANRARYKYWVLSEKVNSEYVTTIREYNWDTNNPVITSTITIRERKVSNDWITEVS